MSRRHFSALASSFALPLMLAAMAAGPRPAEAGPVVYAETGLGEFGTLDLATGDFTSIGSPNGLGGILTMGYAGGQLYGFAGNGELFQIDPATGASSQVGIGPSPDFAAAADNGTFYAFGADQGGYFGFSTFAPPSTQPIDTSLNVYWSGQTPFTFYSTGMIAFGPDGNMYLAASAPNGPAGTYALATAGPLGGVATEIGSMGSDDVSLGLFVGSTLYGFEGGHQIVTIDTTTGAVTPVATTDANVYIAAVAAFSPSAVPEGNSLAMLATGVVGAGLASRLRRRA